jgi:hypothetical protein
VSAGGKKRAALDTNNTNTVKAALSNRIYVYRTQIVKWGAVVYGRRILGQWETYEICPKSNENGLKFFFIEHTSNYSLSPSK